MLGWKAWVGAGLVVVAADIAVGAAQEQPPAAPAKTFEVASVRANPSGTTQTNINFTPAGVTFTNVQLRAIIQFAYGINQPSRLAGVPEWANNERFDIVARGAVSSLEDRRVMLQRGWPIDSSLPHTTNNAVFRSTPSFSRALTAGWGHRSCHRQSTARPAAEDAVTRRR